MRRIFGVSTVDHVAVSRHIGRKEYDQAIKRLTDRLSNSASDVYALEMIALCHLWSGRHEEAIAASKQALAFEPRNFSSLSLLGEIFAELERHEEAIEYVNRAMAAYPEPTPGMPNFVMRLMRLAFRLTPSLRNQWEDAEKTLRNPNARDQSWYAWARKYQRWYSERTGGTGESTLH